VLGSHGWRSDARANWNFAIDQLDEASIIMIGEQR